MFEALLKSLPSQVKRTSEDSRSDSATLDSVAKNKAKAKKNDTTNNFQKSLGTLVECMSVTMKDRTSHMLTKTFYSMDKMIKSKKKTLANLKTAINNKKEQENNSSDDDSCMMTVEDMREEYKALKVEVKILTIEKAKLLQQITNPNIDTVEKNNKRKIVDISNEEDDDEDGK